MGKTALIAGAIATLALACDVPARADEATTELGAGGIALVRNEVVELLHQDVFVSASEIRVTYRLRNKTQAVATFLIAAPLPAIDASGSDELNLALAKPDSENFIDLQITVDGQPVTPAVSRRAIALGIDRTAELTALGLSLNPSGDEIDNRIKALPADKRAELNRLGLITIAGDEVEAAWRLETTLHWQQTFPPGQEVVIEQRYRPVVGHAAFGLANLEEDHEHHTTYCLDDTFIRVARNRLNAVKNKPNPNLDEQRISFVLSTTTNWSGPIKSFRLVVDKGDGDALLSSCLEGLRKISATQYELKASDFTSDRDLEILIVNRHKDQ